MTTLSLGMIVRNELDMLTRTVPVYAPFFQSKWALDTGSTDSTIAYLREQGFVVWQVDWTNDYAAARNTLLRLKREASTDGWLLMLDADECMWPADLLRLQELCATTSKDVVTLPRINLANAAQHQEVGSWPDKQARCLRLSAPLEHCLPVHEVVHYVGHDVSVVGELRDEFASECPIYHYGMCKSPQNCWLRSHNYRLIAEGQEPIDTVPNDIATITPEQFFTDLCKRHTFEPFTKPHPLQGRL